MPGRPRTPTALKLIRGTDAHHPVVPDDFQPTGDPVKPKWLKGIASKKWDEVAPQLIDAGVMKSIDGTMFAAWCSLAGDFERLKGKVSPAVIAQMRGLAQSFGLEPSSRGKIKIAAKAQPVNPAEKYFK